MLLRSRRSSWVKATRGDAQTEQVREEGSPEGHSGTGKEHPEIEGDARGTSYHPGDDGLTKPYSKQLSDFEIFVLLPSLRQMKVCQGFQIVDKTPVLDELNCDNHPFFERLHPLSDNMKIFYNSILSAEGNIFEAYTITWLPSERLC